MSSFKRLRIGTRGSPLARWQAEWIAEQLRGHGIETDLVLITTTGDVTRDSLSVVGGQGLFTKEIQRALLDQRVDLAVHSLKDLPTEPVPGLVLAAVPPRASPFDVFVSLRAGNLEGLPASARIGTGSRRRQSQLRHVRPDFAVEDIRGNIDTRLRKLDDGEFDAIVLAEAGLRRLGLVDRITQIIPPSIMVPAIGQGALGIETRADDAATMTAVRLLDDADSHAAVAAERTLLSALRGGCLAPIGAWGRIECHALWLSACVLSVDGRQRVSVVTSGDRTDPAALGRAVAGELLALGAADLIASAR